MNLIQELGDSGRGRGMGSRQAPRVWVGEGRGTVNRTLRSGLWSVVWWFVGRIGKADGQRFSMAPPTKISC